MCDPSRADSCRTPSAAGGRPEGSGCSSLLMTRQNWCHLYNDTILLQSLSLSLSIILLLPTRNLFFFCYIRSIRENTHLLSTIFVRKCYRNELINFTISNVFVGRDSAVGIATRYSLDGPVIESQWGGRDFLTRPHRPRGHSAVCKTGTRSLGGGSIREVVLTIRSHLAPRLKKE